MFAAFFKDLFGTDMSSLFSFAVVGGRIMFPPVQKIQIDVKACWLCPMIEDKPIQERLFGEIRHACWCKLKEKEIHSFDRACEEGVPLIREKQMEDGRREFRDSYCPCFFAFLCFSVPFFLLGFVMGRSFFR